MGEPQAWRFYVYALTEGDAIRYVGKGSGRRLQAQRRNHKLEGHEIARFKRESDAYAFEITQIAEHSPPINSHPGGNGSKATPQRQPRKDKWTRNLEAIGHKRYAARLILEHVWKCPHIMSTSELEIVRQVAYG